MIKRNSGWVICLTALSLLTLAAFSTSAKAETLTALVLISPLNEVPPITNLNASGGFQLTIEITRAPNGNITSARLSYLGVVQFPGAVTITGLRIYEGEATTNGAARFDSGISTGSPVILAAGAGIIDKPAIPADPIVLVRLLTNPAGFYLNLHTSANSNGALRAQLTKFTETLANTVTMTTAQEVPAPTGQTGTAQATLTFNPTRNAQGQVTGGSVLFTLLYDFSSAVTFTGLHIHEGAVGVPGPVRINTGLSGSNTIVFSTGKGVINLVAPVSTADEIGALTRLLADRRTRSIICCPKARPTDWQALRRLS